VSRLDLTFPLLLIFILVAAACDIKTGPDQHILEVGDNFQEANDKFPEGTTFIVKSGVHTNQTVRHPKNGNSWIGEEGAVMDGRNRVSAAFSGEAKFITINGIKIRNYKDNGIHLRDGGRITLDNLTIKDTGSGTGNKNGAIKMNDMVGIHITNSHFTQLSAGILITDSKGPIIIEQNSAINIGRNFVQLDKCEGEQIRVQYNTMERVGDYLREGAEDVVDWISIFQSEGTKQDSIQVNYNRARGHGNDPTGSFIMLGDDGGRYQVAKGNLGINPGQVGIGIAGGEWITVQGNILFTEPWEHSNVGIYSAQYSYPNPCHNHSIINNRLYWHNGRKQNNIWTDMICEPTILHNVYPDSEVRSELWYSFNVSKE